MPITSAQAGYRMQAVASPDGVGIGGSVTIGPGDTAFTLTGLEAAYAVKFEIALGVTVTFNPGTGVISGTTSGTAQVETATVVAASGATSNGNLAVTVTAAGVTGSPLAFSVPLTTADNTAALVAQAIRTALNGSDALAALYTVGGASAAITLTGIAPAANDTTLNIAITAGLGVSAITNSTNTTAGVQATKAYRISGQTWDTEDYQGVAIPAASDLKGILIVHESGNTEWDIGAVAMPAFNDVEVAMRLNNDALAAAYGGDWEFTSGAASVFTVYIAAA